MVLNSRDWVWLVGLVIADQVTKCIALLTHPNNILFELTWNTGAGFGILQDKNWLLALISIVVLVLIWRPVGESKGHEHAAFIALAAGVFGNLIDRLVHGAVVDFISIGAFPVFNVADSLITVGILFLLAKTVRESFSSWHFRKKAAQTAAKKKK